MRKIVAFDFDGTLTTSDTLIELIRYAHGTWALLFGLLCFAPLLVMMKLRLYPNYKVKQKVFARFFGGMSLKDFDTLCRRFAETHRHLLRPSMLETLRQSQADGAEVVVISASMDNWVNPFLDGVKVIGTQPEVDNGILTGRFATPNCYGQEKVTRLLADYPDRQSYHLTAYGDSRGDKELLASADDAHFVGQVNLLNVFRLKPEERLQAYIALAVIILFNVLFIYRMHGLFLQEGFGPYWKVFERELHLSGYDPLTYLGVTDWDVVYQAYRHPLLSFLIYPLYLLNQGLSALLGVNCVQYIVALPLVLCSFYSYVFLYRIHREVIGLCRQDATLLTAFHFSFAYILLSVIVPDHFTPSMFLLLLMLYVSGICIQKGRRLRWWQSLLFFLLTAGVTLTNGVKVQLAGLFVNLRDFFRPKYLLLAVVLPAALLWSFATWQYRTFVLPKEKARAELRERKAIEVKRQVAQMTPEQRQRFEQRKAKREKVLRRQAEKTGKPMEDHGFLKWTDISTSRWHSAYENLFGESLQFHQDYFLEDTLVHRPVFVAYRWLASYAVEAVVLLLALIGVWHGRRSRFLWLCLSCFAFDMFIHLILGFGINEVFIMAPHFMFVLPISTAFLFHRVQAGWLRAVVLLLTSYLFIYNGWLLTSFLLSPIRAVL